MFRRRQGACSPEKSRLREVDPKKESKYVREAIRFLNEQPGVLRVIHRGGWKTSTVRGDWNVRIVDTEDQKEPDDFMEEYRRAVIEDPENPPMVVSLVRGRAAHGRRITRHPVALVPLTVLLERLKDASVEDSVWGIG